MSLGLHNSPGKPDCTIFPNLFEKGFRRNEIRVGDLLIDKDDFAELVMYFFTNTDLEDDDVRRDLKRRIESLEIVDGFNGRNTRFEEKK